MRLAPPVQAFLDLLVHSAFFGLGYLWGTTGNSDGLVMLGGFLMAFAATNLLVLALRRTIAR